MLKWLKWLKSLLNREKDPELAELRQRVIEKFRQFAENNSHQFPDLPDLLSGLKKSPRDILTLAEETVDFANFLTDTLPEDNMPSTLSEQTVTSVAVGRDNKVTVLETGYCWEKCEGEIHPELIAQGKNLVQLTSEIKGKLLAIQKIAEERVNLCEKTQGHQVLLQKRLREAFSAELSFADSDVLTIEEYPNGYFLFVNGVSQKKLDKKAVEISLLEQQDMRARLEKIQGLTQELSELEMEFNTLMALRVTKTRSLIENIKLKLPDFNLLADAGKIHVRLDEEAGLIVLIRKEFNRSLDELPEELRLHLAHLYQAGKSEISKEVAEILGLTGKAEVKNDSADESNPVSLDKNSTLPNSLADNFDQGMLPSELLQTPVTDAAVSSGNLTPDNAVARNFDKGMLPPVELRFEDPKTSKPQAKNEVENNTSPGEKSSLGDSYDRSMMP